LEGVMSDGRIGHSHNQVPGWDGDHGFGGKCLPKDSAALIEVAKNKHLSMSLLRAAWEKNLCIRNKRDWADIKGAVVQ
jgi:UDPglucose 6-dehydrogenase